MPPRPPTESGLHVDLKPELQQMPEQKKTARASALPERLYVSLEDAAALAKVKVADLLHFGGLAKLRIVTMLPEGLEVRPFDSETGLRGVASFVPEMVVLSPATCRRIECNQVATQGEFSRGYIFELLGPLAQILPSYANPQFSGRWCTWKVYKDGQPHFLEIVSQLLFVTVPDLSAFLSGTFDDDGVGQEENLQPKENFWSDALAFMLQASRKFWQDVSEADKGKFPKNEEVQAWLIAERGLSASQAKAAASLIRPKFAGTGRPIKE